MKIHVYAGSYKVVVARLIAYAALFAAQLCGGSSFARSVIGEGLVVKDHTDEANGTGYGGFVGDDSIIVTPSSGSSATQTFAFSFTSESQAQEHLLFNSSPTGNGACYLIYDRPSNTLYIANDQGNAVSQSATPGGPGILSSSQCSVPVSSASVSASGNTVNLSLAIAFNPSFAGAQNIYANILDTGYVPGAWQQIGTWTVPASAPPPHTVSLGWIASSSPNVIGYNVYRGNMSGGPYARLNSSLDAATAYTDSTVQAGQPYFYVVTSVNNVGSESGYSSEVQVAIPFP